MFLKRRIDSSDVSVVVQGSISDYTRHCLNSIRKFLPRSEIILSTWTNSNVSGLSYDVLVQNIDPKATIFSAYNKYNNLNRILVSSRAGVNAATRKYTLLLRNDLVLKNDNILKIKDVFTKRDKTCSLFHNRIFAYEIFSIKSEIANGYLQKSIFHISDWCRFGLTEDLRELFNIPNVKEPEFSQYMKCHKVDRSTDIFTSRTWKMSPEQYIISENAKKVFHKLKVHSYLDTRPEVLEASEKFIINNFIVKSIPEWGIKIMKDDYKNKRIFSFDYCLEGAYLGKNQFIDYKKYIDPKFVLPFKYTYKDVLKIEKDSVHFRKHLHSAYFPVRTILRYIGEILSVVFYTVKIVLKSIYYGTKCIIRRITK